MYEKFARLLQENGVTPYRVHNETGVSQSTLSDWKNGKSVPKIDKLQLIADYFEVPVSYLLEDEHEKSPAPENSEQSIEAILEEARKKLEAADSLMFDGGVATPEAIDSVLKAMEVGMQLAKERTDEEKARAAKIKADILRKVEEMDDQ